MCFGVETWHRWGELLAIMLGRETSGLIPRSIPIILTYNVSIFRPRCARSSPSLPPSLLISRNYPSMRCYVGPQLDSFNYVKPRWIAGIIRKRLTQSWCPPRLTRSCSLTQRGKKIKGPRSISFSFVSFLKKIEEGSVFPFLGKGREKKFFFLPIKTRMRESLARPFIVAHAERA